MRFYFFALLIVLTGCLAAQTPHNPMKPEADVAPVESATQADPAPVAPDPAPEPLPDLALPGMRVELMKEMFQAQLSLNAEILKMAELITEEELCELNEWLLQYGVQIERRGRRPAKRESEAF
jgi:hypothetical protein